MTTTTKRRSKKADVAKPQGKPIRMRHVVTTAEVFHLWANQRDTGDGGADWGRNSTGNASFNGRYAFSYNTEIAHLFPDEGIVLLACERWSNTTNQHQSACASAVRGNAKWPMVFTVPYCRPVSRMEHLANLAHLQSQVPQRFPSSGRHHSNWQRKSDIISFIQWANYVRAFGLRSALSRAERDACRLIREMEKEGKALLVHPPSTIEREREEISRIIRDIPSPKLQKVYVLLGVANAVDRASVESGDEDVGMIVFRHLQEALPDAALREIKDEINSRNFRRTQQHNDTDFATWDKLKAEEKDAEWRDNTPLARKFQQRIFGSFACKERGLHRWCPTDAGSSNHASAPQINMLRMQGDTVVTSGGVRIPADEARRLWRMAHRLWLVRTSPIAFHIERNRILADATTRLIARSFRLDSISDEGLFSVGCHRIHFDEMAILACKLGMIDSPLNWRMPALPFYPAEETGIQLLAADDAASVKDMVNA